MPRRGNRSGSASTTALAVGFLLSSSLLVLSGCIAPGGLGTERTSIEPYTHDPDAPYPLTPTQPYRSKATPSGPCADLFETMGGGQVLAKGPAQTQTSAPFRLHLSIFGEGNWHEASVTDLRADGCAQAEVPQDGLYAIEIREHTAADCYYTARIEFQHRGTDLHEWEPEQFGQACR